MIIVGAYPHSIGTTGQDSPLSALSGLIGGWLPPQAALHLLPFNPHCGDGGFSSTSWTQVDHRIGSWLDIAKLARLRYLIVDAIYNHVGVEHEIFQKFLKSPHDYGDMFYAYRSDEDLPSPESPRGGKALRPWLINDERWQIWQTFTTSAVDIRIDHPEILRRIDEHSALVKAYGVSAMRIDAPAYFGKASFGPTRHNAESYRLAQLVAQRIERAGLRMIAQLDSDEPALAYFPPQSGYAVPVVDFSFSAHMALSIITGKTSHFSEHLRDTWTIPNTLIRAPRTHDGILMKSTRFSESARAELVSAAVERGIVPRLIGGIPYELNCSLPFLFGRDSSMELRNKRLQLAFTVAAFVPGICYLYLPALMGYEPEEAEAKCLDEPRDLNRRPVPYNYSQEFLSSSYASSVRDVLEHLISLNINEGQPAERIDDRVEAIDGISLLMDRSDLGLTMIANFSTVHAIVVPPGITSRIIWERGLDRRMLAPLGFLLYRHDG
jgi:hypothetical protein